MNFCQHNDWDDYFDMCLDCGAHLEDLPEADQEKYRKMYEVEKDATYIIG